MLRRNACLGALILSVGMAHGAPPKAQKPKQEEAFDMDAFLATSLNAGQESEKVHKSKRGAWVLARDKSSSPAACSVIFFDRQGGGSISFRGPRPGVGDKGSIVFIHPDIPATRNPAEVKIVLETDGEPAQTVPALHLPSQSEVNAAILVATDIRATVAPMQQSEGVKVSLGGRNVYKLEWDDGGHQARDALLNCLNGKVAR